MKAYILKQNGGIENLVISEVPLPVLKPGEVLVHVKAISINPVDAIVRRDHQRMISMFSDQKQNHILGWDISGTVTEGDSEWIGKDVFGMINFPGHGKAYAEFVASPIDHLALKPSNITHTDAAAATLAALTAWQALVKAAQVKKGDHVLIHAASGGVGHYAVQIAKHFGARVTGTASSANHEFVLNLGADDFIDYQNQQFEKMVKPDVILDSIDDRNHLLRSIEALNEGGRLVSIKSHFDDEIKLRMSEKGITGQRILVKSDGDDMQKIAGLLQSGAIKSHMSKVYTFEELPLAHQQIETRRTRGKIVVSI